MTEEQEQTKERTGWIITFLAALLSITSLLDGGNSAQILDNTIEANNVWGFYQAKSIKQSIAQIQLENAKDPKKIREIAAKIERYESEPDKGEGKKELYTYSNAFFQIGIVILAASMLTMSKRMYWIGISLGSLATILMIQGAFLLVPLTL